MNTSVLGVLSLMNFINVWEDGFMVNIYLQDFGLGGFLQSLLNKSPEQMFRFFFHFKSKQKLKPFSVCVTLHCPSSIVYLCYVMLCYVSDGLHFILGHFTSVLLCFRCPVFLLCHCSLMMCFRRPTLISWHCLLMFQMAYIAHLVTFTSDV